MSLQDKLAVVAAGRALECAGLLNGPLGERAGLFVAVGYLPFGKREIDVLLASSTDADGFSMQKFSTTGFDSVNPLLTFQCLPNMAVFHASVNFDIQGPSLVTYPGPGQLYLALDEAFHSLSANRIDVALVLGVAHQRNFLVEHHFRRAGGIPTAGQLADAAGCIVLENRTSFEARSARKLGRLVSYDIRYKFYDPFAQTEEASEEVLSADEMSLDSLGYLGAASLPVYLSLAAQAHALCLHHRVQTADSMTMESGWELY